MSSHRQTVGFGTILLALISCLFMLQPNAALAGAMPAGAAPAAPLVCDGRTPAVATDRHEYEPGDTIRITGCGYAPDARLTVRVSWPAMAAHEDTGQVTSDRDGAFVFEYALGTDAVSGGYRIEVRDEAGRTLAHTIFYDSHFRFGHIRWTRLSTLPDGKRRVRFLMTLGFRRSFPFDCRNANIGQTCTFSGAGHIWFGDGTATEPSYTVIGIDTAKDWLLATATVEHDYAPGVYTAYNGSCCRISPPTHINNPDFDWRVTTKLDLTGDKTGSPASLLPAIVDCPREGVCRFEIIAMDPDNPGLAEVSKPVPDPHCPPGQCGEIECNLGDTCTTNFRFATSSEWAASRQPGPPYAPSAATVQTNSCGGIPCGIYTWDTRGARRNASGDTFYSTQVIVEERDQPTGNVIDTSALDFLIRIADGPSASGQLVTVPARICGVEGSPSMRNPQVLGENSTDDVLRSRLARMSRVYSQAQMAFRSGASGLVPGLPVIPDPDTALGSSGEMVPGGVEWLTAIHDCRLAWQDAPNVTGVTMLHLNRFLNDNGTPSPVGGMALLPSINNLTSQVLLGAATSMDNRYLLQGETFVDKETPNCRNDPACHGNEDRMCDDGEACQDAQEIMDDQVERLGDRDASNQPIGDDDGTCEAGEACDPVGDDDLVCELRESCAVEIPGAGGDGDGVCDGGEQLHGATERAHCGAVGDPFDSILAHEVGHALTLWHGNGFDNVGGFLDGRDLTGNDGLPDFDEIRAEYYSRPGGAPPPPGGTDPLSGPNLMQYEERGTILTLAQRARLRAQALTSVPDVQASIRPGPQPMASLRVDSLNDIPPAESYVNIDAMAATVDNARSTTGLGLSLAGLLPADISGLSYSFLLDSDNNAATGGDPSTLGNGLPAVQGVDLVGRVDVSTVNGEPQTTPTVYVFDGSSFVPRADPSIMARVERPAVQGQTVAGAEVLLPPLLDSVQLEMANSVRGSLAADFVLHVVARDANTGTTDEATSPHSFRPAQTPTCGVSPTSVFAGSSAGVQASGFLPGRSVAALLGTTRLATGTSDSLGQVSLNVVVPPNAPGGLGAIAVNDEGNGMSAVCGLSIEAAPEFVSPPTPSLGTAFQAAAGQLLTFDVRASDSDGDDSVLLNMIGEGLTKGATFTSQSGNPARGTFRWTPSETLVGTRYVFVITATDQDGISSSPRTVTAEIVQADTTPPNLHVGVTPTTLWPPNHKMLRVDVTLSVSDNADPLPSVRLVSVTSNEPADGVGDGHQEPDIIVESDSVVWLRAERSGAGGGRVYTFEYEARDASGNTARATAEVRVPHNR